MEEEDGLGWMVEGWKEWMEDKWMDGWLEDGWNGWMDGQKLACRDSFVL
jgi:hypothetical protein